MNRLNKTATAAALIALTASAAMGQERAQERRHEHAPPPPAAMAGECPCMMGPMMGGAMMGHGMMGASAMAAMSPAMILRQREALGLEESQVERLESLNERATQARSEHMQRMQPIHERMAAALQGDSPDLGAYEAALREMADGMVRMHLESARSGQEALAVLSSDQRANVLYGMRLMQEMHGRHGMEGMMGGMMGMGMEGCPMMEGGMMGRPESRSGPSD